MTATRSPALNGHAFARDRGCRPFGGRPGQVRGGPFAGEAGRKHAATWSWTFAAKMTGNQRTLPRTRRERRLMGRETLGPGGSHPRVASPGCRPRRIGVTMRAKRET